MPAPLAIFTTVFEVLASDAVARAAKSAWAKMPWSRDKSKVDAVERRIARLVDEAAALAANLSPEAVGPQVDLLLDRFVRDLEGEGIAPDQARQLRDSVRSQLQTSVVRPMEEARRVSRRIEGLESETTELGRRLANAETGLAEARGEVRRLIGLAYAGLGAGVVGTLLALVALLARR